MNIVTYSVKGWEDFHNLDTFWQRRVINSLTTLRTFDDPRKSGAMRFLTHDFSDYWRLALSHYRVIIELTQGDNLIRPNSVLDDRDIMINVIRIKERNEVYK